MCRAGTDSKFTLGSLPSLIDASWDLQCFIHFSAKETTHTSLQYCSSFIRFDLNSLHLTFQVLFMFTADTQIIKQSGADTCLYGQSACPLERSPGSLKASAQMVILHMRKQDGCKNQQLQNTLW